MALRIVQRKKNDATEKKVKQPLQEEQLSAEVVAKNLRGKGMVYLSEVILNPNFKHLLKEPQVKEALVDVFVKQGKELLEAHQKWIAEEEQKIGRKLTDKEKFGHIPQLTSTIDILLDNKKINSKLLELMKTPEGREILEKTTSKREGDFLVVGYMFNKPAGKKLVLKLVLTKEGRQTALAIIRGACNAEVDPAYVRKLGDFEKTKTGTRLRELLSTYENAEELKKELSDKKKRMEYVKFFNEHREEAKDVIVNANASIVADVMKSKGGLELLKEIKKGIEIVDYLWNTTGGRKIVKELLEDEEGFNAITCLVVGMAGGDSLYKLLFK